MAKRLIIRVHSGICDQIKFLAHGLAAEKRGRQVVFDTSWYETNGRDTIGRFSRTWELPEAFPGLRINGSPSVTAEADDELLMGFAPIGPFLGLRHELADAFRPAISAEAGELLRELECGHVCAVHVRRGDLSTPNEYYGPQVKVDYIERACRIVLAIDASMRFFFFSDEPDYVAERMLPALSMKDRCRVVALNGPDRGYVDLFLISRAAAIVGSQGSFGQMAAMLSPRSPVFITPCRSEENFRNIPNLIYMNEDRDFEYAKIPEVDLLKLSKLKKTGIWKVPYKLYRHLEKMLMK